MSKLEKFVKTMRIKRRKTCEKAARQKKKKDNRWFCDSVYQNEI